MDDDKGQRTQKEEVPLVRAQAAVPPRGTVRKSPVARKLKLPANRSISIRYTAAGPVHPRRRSTSTTCRPSALASKVTGGRSRRGSVAEPSGTAAPSTTDEAIL